jgi:hypothetical protein
MSMASMASTNFLDLMQNNILLFWCILYASMTRSTVVKVLNRAVCLSTEVKILTWLTQAK